ERHAWQSGRTAAGMHVVAWGSADASDAELVLLAKVHGLMPDALSRHAIEHDCGQGLLLAFANIPETQAPAMAQKLYEAVRVRLRTLPALGKISERMART